MQFIEVDIELKKTVPYNEILIALLNDIKFNSYSENENGLKAYIEESNFDLDLLKQKLENIKEKEILNYKVNKLENNNWNKNWEENFSPVTINKNCIVRATFHEKPNKINYDIVITPKMSFGTGHHETTSLMMQYMFSLSFNNKNILDLGSGTGILSILASKLKAKEIHAIDFDKWAFINSKENALLNNVKNVSCILGDIDSVIFKKYDILLININRNIILSQMYKYKDLMSLNSDILLSGFISEDTNLILNQAKKLDLKLINKKNKKEWNLLHLKKA